MFLTPVITCLGSEHPLSQAIVQKVKELKCEIEEPKDNKTIPGMGIYGSVGGHLIHVGNSKLMKKVGIDSTLTEGYDCLL